MIQKLFSKLLLSIGVTFIMFASVQATVVRMDIVIGNQPAHEVYFELYDEVAPLTVANFLNYVDDGNGNYRYDGTFFHRSVKVDSPGITIIQGGGFNYANTESATGVVKDDPIVNEYDSARPNNQGTIAMARSAALNSATSQWFINVIDNPLPDYAVFGHVLGSGMDVIDSISALPTENQGNPFTDLPIATPNRNPADLITESDLVTIKRVVINPPAQILADSIEVNFGLVAVGVSSMIQTVTISNSGGIDLTIGDIASSNSLGAAFLVTEDLCSAQVLAHAETCQINLQYQPTAFGDNLDSLNIPSDDPGNPAIAIMLLGSGAFSVPTLDVDPAFIDFGNLGLASVSEHLVTVRNTGEGTLLLLPTGITISGADEADFSVPVDSITCTTAGLALSETCTFMVRYTASTLSVNGAAESAALTITTEDPYAQTVLLDLSALVVPSQARLVMPAPSDGSGIIDLGDLQSGETMSIHGVPFSNQGSEDLVLYNISFVGDNADEFSITRNCTQVTAAVGSCVESITFSPITTGTKSALLQVQSNDPENGLATIPITATSSVDNDGVPDSVETAGPNGGDGNRDGTPDVQQQNVTSLPGASGGYITLESDVGTRLSSVFAYANPSSGSLPAAVGASLSFENGFFYFIIEDVPIGGSATVTLYLPEGKTASSYFKFGKLPGDLPFLPERWYQFDFNNGTGAEIQGNRITLHFIDGGRGDNDQTADGRIIDPGGPAIASSGGSSSSEGGGGGCSLSASTGRSDIPIDFMLILIGMLLMRGEGKRVVARCK